MLSFLLRLNENMYHTMYRHFGLGYQTGQGLRSDARANVSVYIFALACFHLVFLVLVGGWGVSFLVIRSDKIRSDLVRSGQIRSGQTRSDQGRSGQGWSLCYVWDDLGVTLG